MPPCRLLGQFIALPALLPLAACNPGAFDDFLAPAGELVLDAGADAAVDMDARVLADARASDRADAQPLVDAGGDARAITPADAALDAADADAGARCFAGGASLISYFPLDGTAADVHGGASVLAVGDTYGVGHVGSALSAGEIAAAQSRLDAPSALTISAWVRLQTAPPDLNAAWLWKGGDTGDDYSAGYWLVFAGSQFRPENAKYLAGTPAQGHLGFALTNGTEEQFLLTDTPFPLERFVHVAATFDGARARLYVDGAIVRDEAQLILPRQTSTPLRLASRLNATTGPLPGALDELALFDRAFSPSEVRELYRLDGVVCAN